VSTTTNELQVKVSERQSGSEQWYEATVSICGLQPTKLARKSDGSTRFTTRSSLTGAARNLAKTLGYNGVAVEEPRRVAAKASSTSKTASKTASSKKKTTSSTQQ
jgi:hypothetical protein